MSVAWSVPLNAVRLLDDLVPGTFEVIELVPVDRERAGVFADERPGKSHFSCTTGRRSSRPYRSISRRTYRWYLGDTHVPPISTALRRPGERRGPRLTHPGGHGPPRSRRTGRRARRSRAAQTPATIPLPMTTTSYRPIDTPLPCWLRALRRTWKARSQAAWNCGGGKTLKVVVWTVHSVRSPPSKWRSCPPRASIGSPPIRPDCRVARDEERRLVDVCPAHDARGNPLRPDGFATIVGRPTESVLRELDPLRPRDRTRGRGRGQGSSSNIVDVDVREIRHCWRSPL